MTHQVPSKVLFIWKAFQNMDCVNSTYKDVYSLSCKKICQNIAMEIQAHCFYFGFGAGEFFFIIFTDYF